MKALVVRFSAIGDCVMAVPVAASIREKCPDAEIVWAVEPRCSAVIDTERLVNELALFDRNRWQRARWSPATWKHQMSCYLSLRKHSFDIGIDLQGQSKTALCLRLAKPAKCIAVRGHDLLSKSLNPIVETVRGNMHTVEHHMIALAALGDFSKKVRFIMPELKEQRKALAGLLPSGRLATIAVSAAGAGKAYPIEGWNSVAEALISRGFAVAFVGGPGDPSSPCEKATDLVGKLPLDQTMAAIMMSAVHLAADTGSGHIAAAYGIPVVSVFGKTPPHIFRPYTDLGIVLDGVTSPTNVKPEDIVGAVESLLQRTGEAVSS